MFEPSHRYVLNMTFSPCLCIDRGSDPQSLEFGSELIRHPVKSVLSRCSFVGHSEVSVIGGGPLCVHA